MDDIPTIVHNPVDAGTVRLAYTRRTISEIAGGTHVMAVVTPESVSIRRVRELPGNKYTPVGATIVGVPLDSLHLITSRSQPIE